MCKKCKEVSMQEERRGFLEDTRRFKRLAAVVVAGGGRTRSPVVKWICFRARPNSNYARDCTVMSL